MLNDELSVHVFRPSWIYDHFVDYMVFESNGSVNTNNIVMYLNLSKIVFKSYKYSNACKNSIF